MPGVKPATAAGGLWPPCMDRLLKPLCCRGGFHKSNLILHITKPYTTLFSSARFPRYKVQRHRKNMKLTVFLFNYMTNNRAGCEGIVDTLSRTKKMKYSCTNCSDLAPVYVDPSSHHCDDQIISLLMIPSASILNFKYKNFVF